MNRRNFVTNVGVIGLLYPIISKAKLAITDNIELRYVSVSYQIEKFDIYHKNIHKGYCFKYNNSNGAIVAYIFSPYFKDAEGWCRSIYNNFGPKGNLESLESHTTCCADLTNAERFYSLNAINNWIQQHII